MGSESILFYWKKSFPFHPKEEIKTFLLLTLNNTRKSLSYLLFYFWWLIALLYLMMYITAAPASLILYFATPIILSFFYIFAARPSIERKDFDYFIAYSKALPAFIILWLPTLIFSVFVLYYPIFVIGYLFTEYLFFISALFYLDSSFSIKDFFVAIKNSLIFALYFLPFLLTLTITSLSISSLIALLLSAICLIVGTFFTASPMPSFVTQLILSLLFNSPIALLLEFFFISALVIQYIKTKHTYPSLFLNP